MYEQKIIDSAKNDDQFPKAVGHKLIVAVPKLSEKTEGGLILPDDHISREQLASICGYVMNMGNECYVDSSSLTFPGGRRCEVGQWVMFRSYTGTRFLYRGEPFQIINDDAVDAVVADPRSIVRR
jgi:co-chaperonin GroES (HSP10)